MDDGSHEEAQEGAYLAFLRAVSRGDNEQVIETASNALDSVAASRNKRHRARRDLLWARAEAYKAKGVMSLALADAKRALKLSSEEPRSYVRTANILAESGHHQQALECLNIAEQKLENCRPEELNSMRKRIDRQRLRINTPRRTSSISDLPDEILLMVFAQLPAPYLVGSVCCRWRQLSLCTPSMWRRLILRKGLTEPRCLAALETFNERSRASLEVIEMPRSMRSFDPKPLLFEMRKSAETLRHIKMPCVMQRLCYIYLYKHCPNLNSLDVSVFKSGTSQSFLASMRKQLEPLAWPSDSEVPFQLEVYKGDPGFRFNINLACLTQARIVHYAVDAASDAEGGETFIKYLVAASDTLEELAMFHVYGASDVHATYSRLQILHNWQVQFARLKFLSLWDIHYSAGLSFPVLLVARALAYRPSDIAMEEERQSCTASTFFRGSPMLEDLELDVYADQEGEKDVLAALGRLQNLRSLFLKREPKQQISEVRFEDVLAPAYHRHPDTMEHFAHVPCPQLTSLRLRCLQVSVEILIRILTFRDYLAKGHTFQEAYNLTQEASSRSGLATSHRAAPFQRGSSAPDTARPVPNATAKHTSKMPLSAQTATFKVARLASLTLYLTSIPPESLVRLEQLADEVHIEYDSLL